MIMFKAILISIVLCYVIANHKQIFQYLNENIYAKFKALLNKLKDKY